MQNRYCTKEHRVTMHDNDTCLECRGLKRAYLLVIVLFVLFTIASMSCTPNRHMQKRAYICINAYQSVTDAPHEFVNLTYTTLLYVYPDTVMCQRGDTIIIRKIGRKFIFEKP